VRKALAALALVLVLPQGARAFQRVEKFTGFGNMAPGKSIDVVAETAFVKFSSGTTPTQRAAALAHIGASIQHEYRFIGWTLVGLQPGMSVANGLTLLKNMSEIKRVNVNHVYRTSIVPNDPLVPSQTNLSQIDAFAGWDFETGSSSQVTIVMIDAGIDATNTDLNSKLLNLGATAQSQDCSDDNGNVCAADSGPTVSGGAPVSGMPSAACDHGTRTSGVAAATGNNGIGIAGISWGANLISLRVFSPGDCGGTSSDCSPAACTAADAALVSALEYATNLLTTPGAGKVVINMSIGGQATCFTSDTTEPGAVQDAIAVSTTAGIPMAIAAGNEAGAIDAPANCAGTAPGSGIIPVGSVNSSNQISSFSNQGPELAANGVVAPGENIETTDVGNSYTSGATGTSFSAPHVAGLAALILSNHPDCGGQNCAVYAQTMIRGGADNIGFTPAQQGAGRIDLFRTLRLTARGTLADFAGQQKPIAFPNPFRLSQTSEVSIQLPPSLQGSNATITIFTVNGQEVRTLSGLTWDGKNDNGNPVVSGTYVFEVVTGAGKSVGRMAVIR